jgi:WD40 repeat protein
MPAALAYTAAGGGVIASAAHDGVVQLWDVRSAAACIQTLKSPLGPDTCDAAVSVTLGHRDPNCVCVGYDSGQVAIFDAATGRLRDLQSPHSMECRGLDLSPDDTWLLSACVGYCLRFHFCRNAKRG